MKRSTKMLVFISLNSTMVRLQPVLKLSSFELNFKRSQFHYGSITTESLWQRIRSGVFRLNSTMVRLQHLFIAQKEMLNDSLNSTMVRLQLGATAEPLFIGFLVSIPLWFDYNSLFGATAVVVVSKTSQFHYGSITTFIRCRERNSLWQVSIPLWFDYNDTNYRVGGNSYQCLNSTMVRLQPA